MYASLDITHMRLLLDHTWLQVILLPKLSKALRRPLAAYAWCWQHTCLLVTWLY